MKVAIIEDELPARQHLISLLSGIVPNLVIGFESATVRDTIALLRQHKDIDLLFMDIQLNDGSSLELFEEIQVLIPVVFTTAFDKYTLEAFQRNGIDYLLKPIKQNDLRRALEKFNGLKHHFSENLHFLISQLKEEQKGYKRRFTGKKGIAFHSIPLSEVAYFFSEHKITFLVSTDGERYVLDDPLTGIEEKTDPKEFFRINRKYFSSIHAIAKYQNYTNGKLLVTLLPPVSEEVIVSQEKAAAFKKWMEQSED